jgi:hypothetical protein
MNSNQIPRDTVTEERKLRNTGLYDSCTNVKRSLAVQCDHHYYLML